jgi:hypothetical protein
MIILSPLFEKTHMRPNRPSYEELYRVPDLERNKDFWNIFYDYLRFLKFRSPIVQEIKKYIDDDFGYFGYRVHPITKEPRYFHVGISLDVSSGRKIYPIAEGVLEYSGYGAVNGYYVLLSHPQIQTEDGYIFHSMYCHLKKPLVKFNSYQKMLREISLGCHPVIPIDSKTVLGTASMTGISRENNPGLYLQFSFRKFDHTAIVIDPMRAYYSKVFINKTSEIIDQQKIDILFKNNQ